MTASIVYKTKLNSSGSCTVYQKRILQELKKYIDEHPETDLTLDDFSGKYNIPLSSMKKYFRELYGISIYQYKKNARMRKAAELLQETNETILTIAGIVGYENGSKFAAAFRSVMGVAPAEYRRME